ncbi:1-deoxy-D-xylulose-5-phosphate reductoisomerase [Falsiroseomonas sp. E2-1-a4]|uniref:1-deoxy-D-xylulose-5-phosphate reductoisomerase n=1 Tax=Falsiroseomonas sp. E2-1-a4 TaxID=3239299 RepID=UPI003F33A421
MGLVTRSVSILGSTGSVGRSTMALLDAAPEGAFRVEALVANRDFSVLAEQALRHRARLAVVADEAAYAGLKSALAGSGIAVAAGRAAVEDAAARPADWTMAAIVGAAGLRSTLAALARGGTLALANKESLVCAAELVLAVARQGAAILLPVDSEHNAIFQALDGQDPAGVEKIILTASGGPFREWTRERMARATPAEAVRHPVWSMGAKISIDSATMMNKGLELIEAARLFPVPEARIEVLVHPQSAVHGLVQFADGSLLAQLGTPDMRTPIAHALAWPKRIHVSAPRLDLAALGRLDFAAPDPVRFPALRLAREALQAGGGAPTILNAANEVAVGMFLDSRLGFLEIASVVEATLEGMVTARAEGLEDILALDAAARRAASRHAEARAAVS